MVDILIKNAYVLTMRGEGVGMIEDGAVAVERDRIVAVGKTPDIEKNYRGADHIFDAKGKAVLPGLVDAHIHTSLTLLRGEAQDVPEIEWMLKTMAPFMNYIEPEHRIKGAKLGVLEAVKSGTTCFGEIGSDMAQIVEKVFIPSGVRACVANTINEIGPESRQDPNKPYIFFKDIGEEKLRESLELIERWNGAAEGRITCMLGPHAADMMSKELLLRVKNIAKSKGLLIHIHVAQGGREAIQIRLKYGTSTIRFLDDIGYFDEGVIAAHCHQASDEEVALLARRGVRYVSCPSSIGLIDGITPPLALFLASGGKYAALGSDQASGNNSHNIIKEMKIASFLNKTRHRDPTILPAWKILRIATIEGASTLGLGDAFGSIEVGKKADLIIMNLKAPHLTPIISKPVRNIAPNIVYSARGDEIETVIVNGKIIMENKRVLTMNEEKVMLEAQEAAEAITSKAAEDYMRADSHLAKAARKGLL
ncbi:amidohydrolase [Candidatus Bathyarchaeota archaeon]|nr:amidohydrolase [Candidatus Bathyarchaeota archaeon]MBS7631849.1 amidohydrolase [Candidatus Bathyarchaeota archaeon]